MIKKEIRERAEQWNAKGVKITEDDMIINKKDITSISCTWQTSSGLETAAVFTSHDLLDNHITRSSTLNAFHALYIIPKTIEGVKGVLLFTVKFTNCTRKTMREQNVDVEPSNCMDPIFIDEDKNIMQYCSRYTYDAMEHSRVWEAKDRILTGFCNCLIQKGKVINEILASVFKDKLFNVWHNNTQLNIYGDRNGMYNSVQYYNLYSFLSKKPKKEVSEKTKKKTQAVIDLIKESSWAQDVMKIRESMGLHPDSYSYGRSDFITITNTNEETPGIVLTKGNLQSNIYTLIVIRKNKSPESFSVEVDGEYKYTKIRFSSNLYLFNKIIYVKENMGENLKYIQNLLLYPLEPKGRVQNLNTYVKSGNYGDSYIRYLRNVVESKNSVFEKVFKIANYDVKKAITKNHGDVKVAFGEYNEKSNKKNLYSILGVNKYQFDNVHDNIIKILKTLLNTQDISSIDNETFDELARLFANTANSTYYGNIHEITCSNDGIESGHMRLVLKSLERISERKLSINNIKKIFQLTQINEATHLGNGYQDKYKNERTFADYIRNLERIRAVDKETLKNFELFPSSLKQMEEAHDRTNLIISQIREQEDAARYAELQEKYDKLAKKRSKLEYEDDEYIIRCPKTPQELKSEGRIQNICIGGYTDRYATGNSMLFLLRKKSNPDVPFFAIEMRETRGKDIKDSEGSSMIQCHGKYNSWISSSEEGRKALPAIANWLVQNKFKASKGILTSTSTSYSSYNSGHCELPDCESIKEALKNKNIY